MADTPSCSVNENAKNPQGQAHTMAGTTQAFQPKGMCWTPNIAIDPTGTNGGVRKLEK